MSIVTTTNAANMVASRRLLQDNLVYSNARGLDIARVQALAASNLLPRDASGHVKLPDDLISALCRPFPGSTSSVNVTNLGVSDQSGQAQPPAAAPTTAAPPPAVGPSSTTASPTPAQAGPLGNLSWAKIAALAAALLGTGGTGAGIATWLNNWPSANQPVAPASPPSAPRQKKTIYELRLGAPQIPAGQAAAQQPAGQPANGGASVGS